MKYLSLNDGTFASVDDEDFIRLSIYSWHVYGTSKACIVRRINNKVVLLTNEVMQNHNFTFDHKDRDFHNNQKSNLRQCSWSQNMANRNGWSVVGFKGVSPTKFGNKFRARIRKNKKEIYLGVFNSAKEAALAYDTEAKKLFGEFALLNFPEQNLDKAGILTTN